MLILTRRRTESTMVGDTKLTVTYLNAKSKVVRIEELCSDGSEFTHNPDNFDRGFEMVTQDCYIEVIEVKGNQARLGFDAPPDINIVRTELLDRDLKQASARQRSGEGQQAQRG